MKERDLGRCVLNNLGECLANDPGGCICRQMPELVYQEYWDKFHPRPMETKIESPHE